MDLEKLWKDKLEGRAWQVKEEFLTLLSFMQENNVKSVLEIGTHKGGTALGFLIIGCNVFSIDIVKQPEIEQLITSYPNDFEFELRANKACFTDSFDMLFIDGDHSYSGCKKDYEEFSPYVKQGGLIVFHDTLKNDLHKSQGCEVWKVLQELEPTVPPFTIVTNGNWGGIFVMVKE